MNSRDERRQELPQPSAPICEAEPGLVPTAHNWTVNVSPVGRNTKEQRSEPRIEANAPALMIPLANVAIRLSGRVLNVSRRGVKVHVDEPLAGYPRTGDVYRVLSGNDVMLCEIRHYQLLGESAEVGFQIVHRLSRGELNSLIEAYKGTHADPTGPGTELAKAASTLTELGEPARDPLGAVVPKALEKHRPVRIQRLSTITAVILGGLAIGALLFASPYIVNSSSPLMAAIKRKVTKARPQETAQSVSQASLENVRIESKPPAVELAKTVQDSPESPRLLPTPDPVDPAAVSPNRVVPAPEVNGAQQKRHARIKASGASWVSACADGRKLFEKALSSGETQEIEFSDKAVVRVGSAGEVEMTLDGKPVGPLGRTGQLRLLQFSTEGMRTLSVVGDPTNDCIK
jgi:hypothetical protein